MMIMSMIYAFIDNYYYDNDDNLDRNVSENCSRVSRFILIVDSPSNNEIYLPLVKALAV